MNLLYPLFLLAGLTLLIPILIHLFNLRKYKTVYFPSIRFLKNIQLHSKKQNELRYKWLLALRLLFLASLVLAFAQPFLPKNKEKNTANKLQVIYIDNSNSMSVKKGSRSLLDIAKESARSQVRGAAVNSRFLLLTNDKPVSYQPIMADKVLTAINNIDISINTRTNQQVFATIQSMVQMEAADGADVYYYSDFQKNAFAARPDATLMKGLNFYGIPVSKDAPRNVYIDTAYLLSPVLQTAQNNQLVVISKNVGDAPKDQPIMQLSINGQVKSAASLSFNDTKERKDTLSFQVNDAGWKQIQLSINDAAVRFDDSFRIAARSTPSLSVLVLNEGQINPYIQAAFSPNNGFKLTQADINTAPADFQSYNLLILNGITRLDAPLAQSLGNALQQGLTICIFPGKTNNLLALNEGFKHLGDVQISGLDTGVQAATSLQQGSDLVKDMFERIPENVQLPQANWHYKIMSGLNANQQSVLSFRNGDPMFARFTPSRGHLYISATSADLNSGNFQASYFFVPFLYQMAMQSKGGAVYAITAGNQQPVYLPLNNASERNMVHVVGKGIDAIPSQRSNGAGLDVYLDQAVQQPGFYQLMAAGKDTISVALNANRAESDLEVWKPEDLHRDWKGQNIKWLNTTDSGRLQQEDGWAGFPLWKVCVILALLMLSVETFILAGSFRKTTVAA